MRLKGGTMSRLSIVGAIILALSGTSISLAAQPTPVPNAAPNFSSMSFLIGTWHCEQSGPGRPGNAGGQNPFAIILAWSDSRVAPETIFDPR